MKNRIYQSILFQLFHGQALKKLFLAQEIRFKRRYQQTFPKTTGTAQEIITACLHHLINQSSLINIEITVCPVFSKFCMPMGISTNYLNYNASMRTSLFEITQSAIVRVSALKIYCNFYHRKPAKSKTIRILLQINLLPWQSPHFDSISAL